MATHDLIVVGGGSAGSVLASRLSEDPRRSVLLVEAGGPARSMAHRIPAAFQTLLGTAADWQDHTAPEPSLDGRRLYWPRGKVLGGSSAINAMIWTPGDPADYQAWATAAGPAWSWPALAHAYGRIRVRRSRLASPNPVTRAFLVACEEAGIRRNDGFTTGGSDGAGLFDLSVHRGFRNSAATAYLGPRQRRPNLTILTRTRVVSLLVERGRATGIQYLAHGARLESQARVGVVLAAGAIGSPELLLRSGIGRAADLLALGLPPVAELPAVGEHLMDHLAIGLVYRAKLPVTLDSAKSPGNLLRYLVTRSGPLASNVAEAGAFLRIRGESPVPDLELLFAPAFFFDHGRRAPEGPGFTIGVVLLQPRSHGRIRLATGDPDDSPVIEPSYLSDERDLALLVEGLERARALVSGRGFDSFRGPEYLPGEKARTGAELAAYVRRRAETLYHPVGTCRMSRDAASVVDPGLRVRGVEGLWVADASIMPAIPAAHPNAATVLIAERAAELIAAA